MRATARSTVPVLSPDDAVRAAAVFGRTLAEGDHDRDQRRALPHDEVKALAATGLLALTVPAAYGGAGVPVATLVEVVRLISWGDPNVGQIPHSHFVYLNQLRLQGSPEHQRRIFGEVLAGATVANAQSEFGTKHIRDFRTTLTRAPSTGSGNGAGEWRGSGNGAGEWRGSGNGAGEWRGSGNGAGEWLLNGEKFYCTGSLFADYLAVLAHLDVDGPLHVAWVRSDAPGVERVDDWDAVGQRTTGSGTVRLSDVVVHEDWITPFSTEFEHPTTYGAFAQVLHAAIDAGIARRALDDARDLVAKARPYPDAATTYGAERAVDDPVVVRTFGELELAVRGTEALLARAARAIDAADADLTDASTAEASLAVAAARASAAAVSVEVTSRIFEVAGTRGALAGNGVDRHWRNARTHTLHDPAAWKVQHLGRWASDGMPPPRHGQL